MKLSVIIPVYNCELYLKECLESICDQDIEGLQVICIDDHSTDRSLEVLQTLKQKHPCIEIYQNEVNKGQAASRNIGVANATGEYIMYVDADDYIEQHILKPLLSFAEAGQADIVMFDTYMFADQTFAGHVDNEKRVRKHAYGHIPGIEMLSALIEYHEMFGIVWGSIYKRTYLLEKKIKFIEGGQHEDVPYIFCALLNAPIADYFHKNVYYYRQRQGSTLYSPDYQKLLLGLLEGYDDMQSVWRKFRQRQHCTDMQEKNIKRYFDSIDNLVEDRYVSYLAEKNFKIDKNIEDKIEKFHLVNREEIDQYFSEDKLSEAKSAKKIVIYGAGFIAKKVYILLNKNGIEVNCFCVSDTVNNPDCLFERPVVKYSDYLAADCIVLAVSEMVKRQILDNVDFKTNHVITLL